MYKDAHYDHFENHIDILKIFYQDVHPSNVKKFFVDLRSTYLTVCLQICGYCLGK